MNKSPASQNSDLERLGFNKKPDPSTQAHQTDEQDRIKNESELILITKQAKTKIDNRWRENPFNAYKQQNDKTKQVNFVQ